MKKTLMLYVVYLHVDECRIDDGPRDRLGLVPLGPHDREVGHEEGPPEHAHPAVGPLLDVHSTYPGVQLDSAIEEVRPGEAPRLVIRLQLA